MRDQSCFVLFVGCWSSFCICNHFLSNFFLLAVLICLEFLRLSISMKLIEFTQKLFKKVLKCHGDAAFLFHAIVNHSRDLKIQLLADYAAASYMPEISAGQTCIPMSMFKFNSPNHRKRIYLANKLASIALSLRTWSNTKWKGTWQHQMLLQWHWMIGPSTP